MQNPSDRPLLVLVGACATVALLAACASLGSPKDQQSASLLWQKIDGHRQWGFFDSHVGIEDGHGPHGKFVATFLSASAHANQAKPPFGSILVKENYTKNDASALDSFTVMQRIEGYDPENGDWFWARFTPAGKLTHSGKVAMCFDCHFDADGDDFVFLND